MGRSLDRVIQELKASLRASLSLLVFAKPDLAAMMPQISSRVGGGTKALGWLKVKFSRNSHWVMQDVHSSTQGEALVSTSLHDGSGSLSEKPMRFISMSVMRSSPVLA